MKVQGPQGAAAQGVDVAAAKRAHDAAAARKQADARPARREASSTDGVTVHVSAAAGKRLEGAHAKPSFDAAKVERLRAVLETGPLPVDAAAVARRMLPDDEGAGG